MLDVLLLLSVTRGLLQSLDDQRRRGWNNGDLGLTILDGELDSDPETFLHFDRGKKDQVSEDTIFKLDMLEVFNRLTQSPVDLAISSPIFLGERPRGPILGARADWAPTSPPVTLRWLSLSIVNTLYSRCPGF